MDTNCIVCGMSIDPDVAIYNTRNPDCCDLCALERREEYKAKKGLRMDTKAIRAKINLLLLDDSLGAFGKKFDADHHVNLKSKLLELLEEDMPMLLDENTKLKEHLENEQQDLGDLHEMYVQEAAAHREKVKQLLDEIERLEKEKEKWRIEAFRKYPTPEAYDAACAALEKHRKNEEQLQSDKAVAVETLKHIVEYWNRDQNELAMADALWHIIETAESATERIESGEKG